MFELVEVSKVECVGLHDDAGELFVPCEHPEDAVHQGGERAGRGDRRQLQVRTDGARDTGPHRVLVGLRILAHSAGLLTCATGG